MNGIALVLVCFACVGHGRRVQTSVAFNPATAFTPTHVVSKPPVASMPMGKTLQRSAPASMSLPINLEGKVAFVAGVADSSGYGWAIAKALAEAGAKIVIGTWPPVLKIFEKSLKAGKFDEDMVLADGSKMVIDKIYPLDAVFDSMDDVPQETKDNKRYAGLGGYTITEVAEQVKADYGNIDILVHSLANGPEVTKPLLETSRKGYLMASSASAYSMVSLVQQFAPIMNKGGSVLSLTYVASVNVIPGYGGGMSSAKAALESDTRTLAFEAGRKYGIRVNTISAGPLKSRAASAIGKSDTKSFIEYAIDYSKANSPMAQDLYSDDVGAAACFLLSPLARAITGEVMYVDNGLNMMGMAVDSSSMEGSPAAALATPGTD
jgi:enoyl-[acyl-carrier protein] reductase I